MGHSYQAVCSLALIVAVCVGAVVWSDRQPNEATWQIRISAVAAAVVSGALMILPRLRMDEAPDYLHRVVGRYFNTDGFCFAVRGAVIDGVFYLDAYFQNQQDRPALGRIAIRPGRNFFLNRAKIKHIAIDIDCAPAAFGVVRIPVPLREEQQGRRQSFEVGASVYYPKRKGRRLRFRNGIFLRTNPEFVDPFGTAVAVVGALGGHIAYSKPANVSLRLPTDVAVAPPADAKQQTITFWKLDDGPLNLQQRNDVS